MKVSELLKLLYADIQMVLILEYYEGNGEGKELFHGEAREALKSEYAERNVESFIPGCDDLIIYLE